MDNKTINVVLAVAIAMTLVIASIPTPAFSQAVNEQSKTARIGYFPNINHAQAVIGLGRGDFQKALGDNVEVKTQIFNAGPA
ncbi:MAG TPA: sulfate ABC transporter substrate-binding protein, partial [Nitrososphaeraceae archaeon]|nr:sulfate ABC transporter substrate-binding protein [Nitrososphaeraceae archaeon]